MSDQIEIEDIDSEYRYLFMRIFVGLCDTLAIDDDQGHEERINMIRQQTLYIMKNDLGLTMHDMPQDPGPEDDAPRSAGSNVVSIRKKKK